MKRMIILVSAVAVFSMAGVGYALEDGLGVDVDATWVSKYIWRGFDMLDDHAAFQPSVNVDLYQTGLSVGVWASIPGSSGYSSATGYSSDDSEEWRYTVAYSNSLTEGIATRTDYVVGWRYYEFPDTPSRNRDAQEIFLALTWPDVNVMGLTPHYMYSYLWGSQGDGPAAEFSGAVHVVGLNYDYTCPDMPELPLSFSWDVVYNDGQGGESVEHDWSHMTWGLSTIVNCPMTGAKVKPAVYYQTSMEDSVNTEDELYAGVSFMLSF